MESSKENVNESSDDEKPNSIDSGSNDDVNVENNGDPTVSIKNVNELKVLDFYSADDVRQSIKSAIANKTLFTFGKKMTTCTINEASTEPAAEKREEDKEDVFKDQINSERVNINGNSIRANSGPKKRGRPIKTGPSKRPAKRFKIDDFYVGKLSNFVPYKRREETESEYDSESGVLY